jgi:hypothetical protein
MQAAWVPATREWPTAADEMPRKRWPWQVGNPGFGPMTPQIDAAVRARIGR